MKYFLKAIAVAFVFTIYNILALIWNFSLKDYISFKEFWQRFTDYADSESSYDGY